MPDNELQRRVITGAGIGIVIIGATLWGVLACYFLVMTIVAGSSIEFFRMQILKNVYVPTLLSATPLIVFILLTSPGDGGTLIMDGPWLVATCAAAFGIYFFTQLALDTVALEKHLVAFSTSLFVFTIPGLFAIILCALNPKLLLGIFILIWSSDTFAYFGGRAFGRHKLLPRVSPKKTWEGFLSGLIAALLMAWGLRYFFTEGTLADWMITAALVVIFGTMGDLMQSVFKRNAGVKDSGNIFPGHGGFWDRFDSFLGCLPWVGAYYLLM